jgi:hypothetical protein
VGERNWNNASRVAEDVLSRSINDGELQPCCTFRSLFSPISHVDTLSKRDFFREHIRRRPSILKGSSDSSGRLNGNNDLRFRLRKDEIKLRFCATITVQGQTHSIGKSTLPDSIRIDRLHLGMWRSGRSRGFCGRKAMAQCVALVTDHSTRPRYSAEDACHLRTISQAPKMSC